MKKEALPPDHDLYIWMGGVHSLYKSQSAQRKRHIFGEASNENLDLEGDLVDASGVRDSMDFWKSHGKLDWCHKGSALPDYLIGEPVDWLQKDGRLMIEGELYDNWSMADKVYQLLKSGARLGYSLGGKILKTRDVFDKTFGGNVTRVQKVFVNHVAVTPFPVNITTSATLVPWNKFLSMLDKDITGKEAGAGDSELAKNMSTISGSSLLTESLEGSGNKELVKVLKNIITNMRGGGQTRKSRCSHFAKSGRFHSPRHAHEHCIKCEGLSSELANIMTDYLVLQDHKIATFVA